jgi:hypothetical protein
MPKNSQPSHPFLAGCGGRLAGAPDLLARCQAGHLANWMAGHPTKPGWPACPMKDERNNNNNKNKKNNINNNDNNIDDTNTNLILLLILLIAKQIILIR